MAINTYVPTAQANTAPIAGTVGTSLPIGNSARSVAQAQASFEWFDYGQYIPGQGTTRWETNPPFKLWDGDKLIGSLDSVNSNTSAGVPGHILRGYIRRAEYSMADRPSKCRLQFLYNPTQITRNYVSYLDQGALDPFNSVYQSGNLVAPPSFMDFTFELLFDRFEEATLPNNPGVLIDMDYFDLVVRNVVPTSARQNNALPDNGLMMVNPRDITVVFSPSLSVQGRPTNAQVVFQKFTHRMTPTRMTIALTMRVVYLGPVRDLTTFVQEQVNVARRVPFDIVEPVPYDFKFEKLEWESNGEDIDPKTMVNASDDRLSDSDGSAGTTAATVARDQWQAHDTHYNNTGRRHQLWGLADCSSFVWGGFADTSTTNSTATQSMAERLGWAKFDDGVHGRGNIPSVAEIFTTLASDRKLALPIFGGGEDHGVTDGTAFKKALKCKRGDLLLRVDNPNKPESNHIAFVWDTNGNDDDDDAEVKVVHAAGPPGNVPGLPTGVGYTDYHQSSKFNYNFAFRVTLGFQGDTTEITTGDGNDKVTEAERRPGIPKNFEGDPRGGGDVKFTWNAPDNKGTSGITSYTIEMASAKAGPFDIYRISSLSPYTWKDIISGVDALRYFKIACTNSAGTGPYSDVITVPVEGS